MVYFSVLGSLKRIKRIAIPFSAMSSASLFATFNTAHAETMSEIILQPKGILLSKTEGKGFIQGTKQMWENIETITKYIIKGLDWLLGLPLKIPEYSADLLTLIYKLLSQIALQTPSFLFNNPVIQNTSLTFSLVSISIVTILTVYEGFMQMFKQDHTPLKTIIKRWVAVSAIGGFLPFMFEQGFKWLNKLSLAIANIGNVNGGSSSGFINSADLGFFDTLIVIAFDITAISMLIPFALQAGRRWIMLGILFAISPLALSARVFDRHKRYFDRWLDTVKELSIVQLVQAVFLLIMGCFIFSTQAIQGGIFIMVSKLLLVMGGLHYMINPPSLITSLAGGKDDVFDVYDEYKKTFNNIKDTVTGKNLRPVGFIQNMITKNKETKLKQKYGVRHLDVDSIKGDLRKKTGKRFVDDII
jgi:hypothetical protein